MDDYMGGSGRPPSLPASAPPAQPPSRSGGDLALLALLQLTDGLFPAGGFAHSLGLETYVQAGLVKDRAGLEAFVRAHLEGSAGPSDAVAVATTVRRATADDLEGCLEVDARRLTAGRCDIRPRCFLLPPAPWVSAKRRQFSAAHREDQSCNDA